jgi:hypothetical protein
MDETKGTLTPNSMIQLTNRTFSVRIPGKVTKSGQYLEKTKPARTKREAERTRVTSRS